MQTFLGSLLVALLLGPAAALAAAPEEHLKAPRLVTYYTLDYLDLHDAEALAWDQCPHKESCEINSRSGNGRALVVSADAATQDRVAHMLAREDAPQTQAFQLTLLLADDQPEPEGSALSKSNSQALRELREILPFRGYHLLDMAWVRATQSAKVRLGGPRGFPIEVEMDFHRLGGSAGKKLFIRRFILRQDLTAVQAHSPAHAEHQQVEETATFTADPLLTTSFGVDRGETVVVGTSKLPGTGQAIVLLLTAVS